MSTRVKSAITGSGAALPGRVITNTDLEKIVDTNDEWIVSRTGVRERRKLEDGLSSVDLAEKAAEEVKKTIEECGGSAVIVKANVSQYDECEKVVKCAIDHFKRIDILINNAGITRDNLLARMKVEELLILLLWQIFMVTAVRQIMLRQKVK